MGVIFYEAAEAKRLAGAAGRVGAGARPLAALALAMLLGACVSTPRPLPPVTQPQPGLSTPPPTQRPEPQMIRVPGLESVLGAPASVLLRSFGDPRIDLVEGDVRKLQFSGAACVLDIYLYPPTGGGDPIATYVEARRASDGQDVDRVACVDALRRR